MEKQISAVDFLIKEFSDILGAIETTPMQNLLMVDGIKQAKEMFELQITRAYSTGGYDERDNPTREAHEYFEEVFKTE